MAKTEKELIWDEQLTPLIHDDGKGLTLTINLVHEDTDTDFTVNLSARYAEVGLPSYDSEALAALALYTTTKMAAILFKTPDPDDA